MFSQNISKSFRFILVLKATLFHLAIITVFLFLSRNSLVFAACSSCVGSGQLGTTFSFAFESNKLSYSEIMNGGVIDQDLGRLKGGYIEVRGDDEESFIRLYVNYLTTTSATYNGTLQTGTPITMVTNESILHAETNAGIKVINFWHTTITPYVAAGYRDWFRGEDNLPNYKEEYVWWYAGAGVNITANVFKRLLISVDGSYDYLINPQMKTDVAGQMDNTTFSQKPSRPCYKYDVTASYAIYKSKKSKIYLFGTQYYELWQTGASNATTLQSNGVPTGSAVEPQSKSSIYGYRAGFGFNY